MNIHAKLPQYWTKNKIEGFSIKLYNSFFLCCKTQKKQSKEQSNCISSGNRSILAWAVNKICKHSYQINFSYSCLESQKSIWKLYQSDSQTTVFTFKWFSLPLDTWLISSLRFCHDIRIKKIEFCVFSEPWGKAKEAFAWLEKLQKDCIYCRRQYVRLLVHCILYVPTIALPCWGGWKNQIP